MAPSDAKADETCHVAGPGGAPVALRLLHQGGDEQHAVRVLATADRLQVFLDYVLLESAEPPAREALDELLAQAGVAHGVDPEGLDMARILLRERGRTGLLQVAAGTRPRPAVDGHIEWLARPTSEKVKYDTDELGAVDFRQTFRIENVRTGQDIAILHPPTAGAPGRDVFGNEIPAPQGADLSVHMGKNALLDEKRGRCVAAVDGRVVFEDNKISVSDQYEIRGDVDYAVGNVDFIGDVIVTGNVLDDFSVAAAGTLTVHGTAGACQLRGDGDVTIVGGMAGKGRGSVRSRHGRVVARYLNETEVEAQKDVLARNEIVNASVRSGAAVRVPGGTIVGGEVHAFSGVEAKVLGSSLGVATRIEVAVDWMHADRLAQLDKALRVLQGHSTRLENSVRPFVQDERRMGDLSAAGRQLVRTTLEQIRALRARCEERTAEREALLAVRREGAVSQVNVLETLHPGVALRVGAIADTVTDPFTGPLSVVPRPDGPGLRITRYRELPAAPRPPEQTPPQPEREVQA